MRLQRRGLVRAYIKVPEVSKNGKQHLHIIYEGEYIAQVAISEMWEQIHQAKVIDIRLAHLGHGKKGLARYLAKYMSKEGAYRYSWSWSWVWKGFVKDWTSLKRLWRYNNMMTFPLPYDGLLRIWRHFLMLKLPYYLRSFLDERMPEEQELKSVLALA